MSFCLFVFLFICFSCFSFFHQTDVEGMEQRGRFFLSSQYGGRTEGGCDDDYNTIIDCN